MAEESPSPPAGTLEPNRAMSDEDAQALTAFLISQRGEVGRGRKGREKRGRQAGGRKEMKHFASAVTILSMALLATSCSHKSVSTPVIKPTAFGAAIVESSGGKQLAQTGTLLAQPVIVQVNDAQGTAVPGALVQFEAASGVTFDPASALTDSSGQVTTNVSLGGMAGRYQITASTFDKSAQKSGIENRRDRAWLSAGAGQASQRSVLRSLPQRRIHCRTRFQLRQPGGQAASVHRRVYAEQDERRRSHSYHHLWRTSP